MNGQKGMTIVEMLVSIAITGIIVAFLGTAIYQILTVSEYGNDRLTAMHELQNSAHWFNLDGQKAVTANVNGELLLTISETTSITYSLVGTELHRTSGGSQMTLARNIASAVFSIDNRVITMSLTSSPEGRYDVSENGTYKVFLRPSEGG
jgi:prepilin-type N-terminal cleavage/methylation domain-containing protein